MIQGRTEDQALTDVLALLPEGFASTHSPDDYLGARFRPLAAELALLEAASFQLLPEVIDPRDATDLLTDWEAEMDTAAYLGDPASYNTGTREDLVFALLTKGAPVCAGDWERLALLIGQTITITELPASACGRSFCGTSTLNPAPGHQNIIVNMGSTVVNVPQCGAAHCGDLLGRYAPSPLEPAIRAGVRLGVTPTFNYV
ncbi:MAG TPA: DUF2313 domain-containing protein [Gammaproteobacteria bacterium]|nr:DUF2313 domain-containing protein [Gammaproteobacteria bacterium]